MIIISRLELKPRNMIIYPCRIFYKKDNDVTTKIRYDFSNEDGSFLLLDGIYNFSSLRGETNKVTEINTGKEVYFEDLIKTNDPPKPQIKEVVKKKVSFWDKIKSWFK